MASPQPENTMAIIPLQSTGGCVNRPFETSSFNFERDISQHVNPAILSNSHSILAKCQHRHRRVVLKHCETNGVIFIKTTDTDIKNYIFLPREALEKALKEADEESVNMLGKYLPFSAYADPEIIINQLKTQNRRENERLSSIHQKLQSEFIETMKSQAWHEFLESLTEEYYYLVMNYVNTEIKQAPFYNQERMRAFVLKSKEKCTQAFADKLRNIGIDSTNAQVLSLCTQISKATEEILKKNQKHEENCRNYISKLLQTGFRKEGRHEVEEMVNKEPLLFKNKEDLNTIVIAGLQRKFLKEIVELSKAECLENPEEFCASYVEDVKAIMEDLVKHGMTILNEWQGRLNPVFMHIKTLFFQLTQKVCKDNQVPDSVSSDIQKRFMDVMNEYKNGGFYSEFANLTLPSADSTLLQAALTQATSSSDSAVAARVATVSPLKKSRPTNSEDMNGTPSKRLKDIDFSLSLTPIPAPPQRTPPTVNSNSTSIVWHNQPNRNSKQNQLTNNQQTAGTSTRRSSRWTNGL